MQQAIALAVILGIASGLTGAWLLQREDDRRAALSADGLSARR
jgi:ABC-type Mn2+/Zn2+ transport system permease subunit